MVNNYRHKIHKKGNHTNESLLAYIDLDATLSVEYPDKHISDSCRRQCKWHSDFHEVRKSYDLSVLSQNADCRNIRRCPDRSEVPA